MRVTSDRQTLILAGETPPRSSSGGVDRLDPESSDQNSPRVTIISARVDAVVTQSVYTSDRSPRDLVPQGLAVATNIATLPSIANASAALPDLPPRLHQAFMVATRSSSSNALNAYARTQDHFDRIPLIDTYA